MKTRIAVLLVLFSGSVLAELDNKDPESKRDDSAITLGFLNGGGGLIGVDYELMPFDNPIGFQVGIGLVSYGAGINYHFSSNPKSSFVSLKYWDQNFSVADVRQNTLGLNWVYRGSSGFTGELGIGKPLSIGSKLKTDLYKNKIPDVMLMYSIGWYFSL